MSGYPPAVDRAIGGSGWGIPPGAEVRHRVSLGGTKARLAREFCSIATACEPRAGLSDYRVVAPHLDYQGDVEVTL
eukprot:scaffold10286_cov109-Isochrysis_galbana.AAC.2